MPSLNSGCLDTWKPLWKAVNMDDRFIYINELIDFYEQLLTPRQKEMLHYHYREDLSLSEIAENLGISRNGVYDALKKAEDRLEEYEELLHLYRNYLRRTELYRKLLDTDDDRIKEVVDELIRNEEDQ